MISSKYVLEVQDDCDDGKTLVILSIIDESTNARTRLKIATFEDKLPASDYVDWMNSRVKKKPDA